MASFDEPIPMPAPAIPHVSPELARSARDFFQHLYARPLSDDDGLDMATNVLGAFGVLREMQQRVDAQRQAAAALRQQLAPYKREADKLEKALGQLHEQLASVEAKLGDGAIYEAARKDELRDALAEQAKLKSREGELEEAWMAALEQLETLEQQLAQAD